MWNDPLLSFPTLLLFGLLLLGGSACTLGPDYQKPGESKELGDWEWVSLQPKDELPKEAWWTLFNDPALNTLEEKAQAANPNLKAIIAQVDIARAQVSWAQGNFFPSIQGSYTQSHFKTSAQQAQAIAMPSIQATQYTPSISVSYELDLWGAIRRAYESDRALLESQLALYYNALLLLQAEVAQQYFTLRIADLESRLLEKAVDILAKNLALIQDRFRAGITDALIQSQAESLLEATHARLAEKRRLRCLAEAAIANLCGEYAHCFHIEETALIARPIEVPPGLPSTLIERRPDVAAVERALQASCANIGVAYARFFPSLSLSGQYGYLSAHSRTLFSSSSQIWAYGPSINIPIFQGGQLRANLKAAQAAYEQNLAHYQATVLNAFKEVENALRNTFYYQEELHSLKSATASAQKAAKLSQLLYSRGLVDYLQVIVSEQTAIDRDIAALDALTARFLASIQLIKALGGGWQSSELRNENVPSLFTSEALPKINAQPAS